jgi:protein-S-isoprenylcysteine O-methyltransferase Ste14
MRRLSAVWPERGVPEVQSASSSRRGPMQIIARLRVALGFTCGVFVFWLATPTRTTIVAGLAVAVVGEAFRFWASGHLNKSREVTRSGPYRFVAHPLYVGSSVIGAGLAVASGSVAVAVIVAAYLAITLTAAIRSEEAFLRRAFGGDYDAYKRTGIVHTAQRFSLARALANREHRAVAGLLAALLLMAWKATYNGAF